MPRVITNLCMRDSSCVDVCPVDCIKPGLPVEQYPTYVIDPDECIDCGACEAECPHSAIFEKEAVPATFIAKGDERISMPAGTEGFAEVWDGQNNKGEPVHLGATRTLKPGESFDLTGAIRTNALFYKDSSGK
jgi:ferredoxin